MKVRESGMPEEKVWGGFFDAKRIIKRMKQENPPKEEMIFSRCLSM